MLWKNRRQSDSVEDISGNSGGNGLAIGGGGCGCLTLILAVILSVFFGVDPRQILQTQNAPNETIQAPQTNQQQDELKQFVKVALADTEDFWTETFRKAGKQYRKPTLTMFSEQVQTGCGTATVDSGPFYCPADERVYIDLAFANELRTKFRAPGDFALAYVVAHEVGHHVQKLIGTNQQVEQLQRRSSETQANALSVRLELQADFYAGMFARSEMQKGVLEKGDIEEALTAASAVGDDRIQSQAQGYVVPDTFTHGTSAQRSRWFKKGFDTGDIKQGNTFNSPNL